MYFNRGQLLAIIIFISIAIFNIVIFYYILHYHTCLITFKNTIILANEQILANAEISKKLTEDIYLQDHLVKSYNLFDYFKSGLKNGYLLIKIGA